MKFGDLSDVDLSVSSHRGLHFWIFWGIRLLMNPNHVLLNLAQALAAAGVPSGDPLLDLFGSSQSIGTQPVVKQLPPLPQLLLRSQALRMVAWLLWQVARLGLLRMVAWMLWQAAQLGLWKTFTIQLETPSGNVIPPNGSGAVTQSLKVTNPQKVVNWSSGLGFDDRAGLGFDDRAGLGFDDRAGLGAGLGFDDRAGLGFDDRAGLGFDDGAGLGLDDGAGLGLDDGGWTRV
eukprot:Em0600g1a